MTVTRCAWAESDPRLTDYHDREWGVPERDGRALWEMLMLEGFQAGLAWITVLRKRDTFRDAFANFDPVEVARFDATKVDELLENPGIIRSRAKIEATICGAQIYCAMADAGEEFASFAWSFTDGKTIRTDGRAHLPQTPLSATVSAELKRRGFKFVGPTIAYAWLQATGIVNDHARGCFRREQV